MSQKDQKIERVKNITTIAFHLTVIGGALYAYNQWSNSATAAAIERNAPKLLDSAGTADTEKAGQLGAFIGGAFK